MMTNYWRETRQTLLLGAPFIANQLLQISVATVDSMMAGADSELTLAAVAQGATLLVLVQLIVIGLAMTLAPMVARAFSRKDKQQLRDLFQQSVWLCLLLSFVAMGLMWLVPDLMVLMGVKSLIIPPATAYLHILALSMPFFCLYLPVRFVNEGMGNPKAIMYITALSIPINVGGNYIFLNGLFGLPKMGAAGIAIASVLSLVFICLLGWWYIFRSQRLAIWQLTKSFQSPRRDSIARFFRIGTPNAIALLMEAGMFSTIVLLSGRLGVEVAAANQIALSYISTTFMIPLGLSMALMTRVGMAMGNNDLLKARIIGLSGIGLGALSMLVSVTIILLHGRWVAGLYSDNNVVLDLALGLLALATIFQIPDGIQVCAAGALRGLEETKAPMRYAIIGYWILAMPLAILLAFYFDWGAKGLWAGLLIGLSVTALLGTHKFIQLTDPKTTLSS